MFQVYLIMLTSYSQDLESLAYSAARAITFRSSVTFWMRSSIYTTYTSLSSLCSASKLIFFNLSTPWYSSNVYLYFTKSIWRTSLKTQLWWDTSSYDL